MKVTLHALQNSNKISAACVNSPRVYPRITRIRLLTGKSAAESAAGTSSAVSGASTSSPSVSSSTLRATNTAATTTAKPVARGFRKYAAQFRDKPASHFISFAILHEITAIVPLPLVYFGLTYTETKIPFPEQALEEGNKFVGRVAKYYGWNIDPSTTDGARMMLNMASSYALVKALMPVRIALCLWMTPWTATRIVSPVMNVWKKLLRK
ncbi:hypothetical protein BGW41_005552 [Actinomortierella wolfii]|nr:hypothetical protein BGW41_005552 [Actinomortierella wolfii]